MRLDPHPVLDFYATVQMGLTPDPTHYPPAVIEGYRVLIGAMAPARRAKAAHADALAKLGIAPA